MSALADPVDALAEAFFGALERGVVEEVNACFAPGATIWHNFDCKTLTPQESVPGLEALFGNFVRREYRDVRRQPTPSGFVQQHVLRLETPDGTVIDWPACIVFDLRDGRIARLDEYVDLSQLSAGS
jgi:ketosteroid isomerase-like protein